MNLLDSWLWCRAPSFHSIHVSKKTFVCSCEQMFQSNVQFYREKEREKRKKTDMDSGIREALLARVAINISILTQLQWRWFFSSQLNFKLREYMQLEKFGGSVISLEIDYYFKSKWISTRRRRGIGLGMKIWFEVKRFWTTGLVLGFHFNDSIVCVRVFFLEFECRKFRCDTSFHLNSWRKYFPIKIER